LSFGTTANFTGLRSNSGLILFLENSEATTRVLIECGFNITKHNLSDFVKIFPRGKEALFLISWRKARKCPEEQPFQTQRTRRQSAPSAIAEESTDYVFQKQQRRTPSPIGIFRPVQRSTPLAGQRAPATPSPRKAQQLSLSHYGQRSIEGI
ncbi:uncharacterized protein Dere_GG27159, partial [Drosophila erecta]